MMFCVKHKMGRFPKSDARYALLNKMPRNVNGLVEFRKRKNHINKFILGVVDLEEVGTATVLYKLFPQDGAMTLHFEKYVRS